MFWFPTEILWQHILFWKNNISMKQQFPGKHFWELDNRKIEYDKNLSQHLHNNTVHEDLALRKLPDEMQL